MQHERSNDKSDALLEREDWDGPDQAETHGDEHAPDQGHCLGRLPVADVAPARRGDA